MIAEGLFAILSADPGVKSALGVSTGPYPIFPTRAPPGQTLPFIVHQLVASTTDTTHDDNSEFEDALYQVSVFAATHAQARAIRMAVYAALQAHPKLFDGSTVITEGQRDLYDQQVDAHHMIVEVRVLHDPTI